MKIALYNRVFDKEDIPFFQRTFSLLKAYNVKIVLFRDFYERLKDIIAFNELPIFFTSNLDIPRDTDFFISLGGDGTMLDAVCFIGDSKIPALGVNLGRLGFLADVAEDEIEVAMKTLSVGSYTIDSRSLIHLDSSEELFGAHPYGLNEFTIHRKDSSQMIKIHTFLNGEFLNTYWADGLIVSTPTGSSGYSLSCNGPIVFPQSNNFILTPVAPHNLNIRPIIVPDDAVLSFEVEGRTDNFLVTLDSRVATITKDVQLAVRRETFDFNLVRLDEHNFLKTLRKKLFWGVDHRN